MAQCVKDPSLSPQPLRLLLWQGFDPWPGDFFMLQMWPEKEKKKIVTRSQLFFNAMYFAQYFIFAVHQCLSI